jgi:hypothetical protein
MVTLLLHYGYTVVTVLLHLGGQRERPEPGWRLGGGEEGEVRGGSKGDVGGWGRV